MFLKMEPIKPTLVYEANEGAVSGELAASGWGPRWHRELKISRFTMCWSPRAVGLMTLLAIGSWTCIPGCGGSGDDGSSATASADLLIETASEVERDEQNRVVGLAFMMDPVSDREIEAIGTFPHLRTLRIQECRNVGDASFKIIASLPQLTKLELLHSTITDAGLAALAEASKLNELSLIHTKITGSGLADLSDLNLQQLRVVGHTTTAAGLAAVSELTALRELELSNPQIALGDMKPLNKLQQLRTLKLRTLKVDDESLKNLEGLTELEILDFDSPQITDSGALRLALLSGLQKLDLTDAKLTNDGLSAIATLENLESLILGGQITDAGLETLKAMKKLTNLDCWGAKVSGTGLEHLVGLRTLRHVDLREDSVNAAGRAAITAFQGSRPECKVQVWKVGESDRETPALAAPSFK